MSDLADPASSSPAGGAVARPQLAAFYGLAALTLPTCFYAYEFLLTRYWFVEDWISKGPVIWLVSLYVVHRDLAAQPLRRVTTGFDVLLAAVLSALLVPVMLFEPLLAPTLLLLFGWYLCAERIDPPRMLAVWLFLLFSLPFYSQLVPGLQWLTVLVSENLIGWLGVPVMVQDKYIAIPQGLFYVERGCSGFNYLANNIMLFFLYSLMSRFDLRQFAVALLVTLGLSLLMNWLRVILIILFAHRFGIDSPLVESHVNFGWALYALFLLPFFYLLLRIDRRGQGVAAAALAAPGRTLLQLPPVVLAALPLLLVGLWSLLHPPLLIDAG